MTGCSLSLCTPTKFDRSFSSPLVLCLFLFSDIIECPGSCNTMSDCQNMPGSFQCECRSGYTGSGLADESCAGEFSRTLPRGGAMASFLPSTIYC